MRTIYAAGFCAALLLLSACATQEPAYKGLNNFTVSNLFEEPRVDMDLNLYNPNPIGGTIRSMEIQIKVDNKVVGSAQLDEKVRMKKQSDFTMPISLTTDIGSLGGIVASGLKSYMGDGQMQVGMSGSITVQKFIVFRKTFAFDYSDGLKAKDIIQK
ncbi:MAG TPA: LEA type 2 family protein [Chitinophagales bacterium]|jgi:LEA14-like dessication related protein|nr:LEA type 2 family protein [Chitinophagales bacterium]